MTPPEVHHSAENDRLQKQVASLKRKVAKLESEKAWAEQERDITERWAIKAWEQVDWLRRLCERYYEEGVRLKEVS